MAKRKPKWTAAELVERLRARHSGDEWVFVTEVPNGTGARKTRSADAMAMGVWKKSGFELHGYEVKVSRSDWQKELNDLSKSKSFEEVSHYWWIVAPDGVIHPGELPESWGWLKPGKSGLNVASRPVRNATASLNYSFFAGIIRKVVKTQSPAELELRQFGNSEFDRGYAAGRKRADQRVAIEGVNRQITALQNTIHAYKEATGIDIGKSEFDARRIGEAVNLVMRKSKPRTYANQMLQALQTLKRLQELTERDLKLVSELLPMWPEAAEE